MLSCDGRRRHKKPTDGRDEYAEPFRDEPKDGGAGNRQKPSRNALHRAKENAPVGGGDNGMTRRVLKKSRRALTRMRVSALRSIKSLIRDRVPARSRKTVETRYAGLLKRISLALAAVEAAAVENGCASRSSSTSSVPVVAALLADVYRLEKELNDADEERDRLSVGVDEGNSAGGDNTVVGGGKTACRPGWFAWCFGTNGDNR